jgi:hypothetical protein
MKQLFVFAFVLFATVAMGQRQPIYGLQPAPDSFDVMIAPRMVNGSLKWKETNVKTWWANLDSTSRAYISNDSTGALTLYNGDGPLDGDRIVDMNDNNLTFSGSNGLFEWLDSGGLTLDFLDSVNIHCDTVVNITSGDDIVIDATAQLDLRGVDIKIVDNSAGVDSNKVGAFYGGDYLGGMTIDSALATIKMAKRLVRDSLGWSGSVLHNGYGLGNRDSTDLSKTLSLFIPRYATDGTVVEQDIRKIINSGTVSGSTDGSGDITATHNIGHQNYGIVVTFEGAIPYVAMIQTRNDNSTVFRIFDMAGAAILSTAVKFDWMINQ